MFLPNKSSIQEIFKETKDVSIDGFETRIRQLHHQYIQLKLQGGFTKFDDVFQFEEEAEYIISLCTHPYRIDKYSSQLIRDGLSISATIFEFLGDVADKYDDKLDSPELYYLKSALCYGLCGFESRTSIIAKRLLIYFVKPEHEISKRNLSQYTLWLVSLYLSQSDSPIYSKSFFYRYNAEITDFIKKSGSSIQDINDLGEAAIYVNLCIACLNAARGLVQGDHELIQVSYSSLTSAKKLATLFGAFQLYFIADTLLDTTKALWGNSPWQRLTGVISRKKYIEVLTRDACKSFWTSQIEALEMKSKQGELKGGYLDEKIRRVVINMPTSAGKSLIAELALAKILFDYRSAKCVYVTPTKALVEQVTRDLSRRFRYFGIRVAATLDLSLLVIKQLQFLILGSSSINLPLILLLHQPSQLTLVSVYSKGCSTVSFQQWHVLL